MENSRPFTSSNSWRMVYFLFIVIVADFRFLLSRAVVVFIKMGGQTLLPGLPQLGVEGVDGLSNELPLLLCERVL